ncbi:hypothetical protein HMI54_006763 [Coelomomyces lativittatus]|nr:hypothetical protein HMI56_002651 [Coelomomyces lativittatus]KAJ1504642.1 hypothetical protein HMI54_006763 [Coelomomyces lativittatus]
MVIGDTWIQYAKKITEQNKSAINHISFQQVEVESKKQVTNIYNETSIQKSTTMLGREQAEKKIVEKINESMVNIQVKDLLQHPGILYQLRGEYMNNKNTEHKLATENQNVRRINSVYQGPREDQIICRNSQVKINDHEENDDRSLIELEGSNNEEVLGTVLEQDEGTSTMEEIKNDEESIMITSPIENKNKMNIRLEEEEEEMYSVGKMVANTTMLVCAKVIGQETQKQEEGEEIEESGEEIIPLTEEENEKLILGKIINQEEKEIAIKELNNIDEALVLEKDILGTLEPTIKLQHHQQSDFYHSEKCMNRQIEQ